MLFHEFLDGLLTFGEEEMCEGYLLEIFMPMLFDGYTPEEIMDKPMEDIIRYLRSPGQIPGWNTVWGKKVVYGDSAPN